MRAVASLLALAVFAPAVLANYFTAPTTSTVWTTSSGQTLLWKQQAGSPSVGTFRISTAEGTTSQVLADSVSLLIQSLPFPDGVSILSPTKSYLIEMISSVNSSYIIASAGPFTINSFGGAAVATSSAPVSSAAATTRTSTVAPAPAPVTVTSTAAPVTTPAAASSTPVSVVTVVATMTAAQSSGINSLSPLPSSIKTASAPRTLSGAAVFGLVTVVAGAMLL